MITFMNHFTHPQARLWTTADSVSSIFFREQVLLPWGGRYIYQTSFLPRTAISHRPTRQSRHIISRGVLCRRHYARRGYGCFRDRPYWNPLRTWWIASLRHRYSSRWSTKKRLSRGQVITDTIQGLLSSCLFVSNSEWSYWHLPSNM